jgi:hypothetical protein
MAETKREVCLSSELCQAVEKKYGGQFGNLEQFLEFVLQKLVKDDAAQMDQAEQHIVEQRLKDLGYI